MKQPHISKSSWHVRERTQTNLRTQALNEP